MQNKLLSVEKPARYMGGEMGSILKENPEARFVLAFPDVYEVGISNLGFQILYGILNRLEWLAAERSYAPWPDMEDLLRQSGKRLATLESGTPLDRVEIIGFTLQYELSYTNILNMLELAGIPLQAAARGEEFPLIIAGGPCACNPEPLAEFIDAFLLGDGEVAVVEIAEAVREIKKTGGTKAELLSRLTEIPGVYVPSFFDVSYDKEGRVERITPLKSGYERVRRRIEPELENLYYPVEPVIPFLKAVHDRVSMEVARGCTRGCRFCQAGYIYRPVRERSPEQILEIIEQTLGNTGYDEVSLLSLSTGDYGCITPLLKELMTRYADSKVAVSFPSLRVGSLNQELVDEIKKVRKTGFTLAPEAGSERLRQVINKGITEEDLLRNAREVYGCGWRLIKLYFMIGLPSETMEDVHGIVELAKKVKTEGKKTGQGGEVNVAVSSFVPKAHTPFQWEPQISYEEILEKQEFLRNELKRRKLNFKWQDAPLSVMEGVFARGDRRLGAVLLAARRLGCRFDGWGEHFSFSKWQRAFAEVGIDPRFYHRRRDLNELLPWDHLDGGMTREFLLRELEASRAGGYTEDCRTGKCSGCGVCDFERTKLRLVESSGSLSLATAPAKETQIEGKERIRLRFEKIGRMRFLSHLEMIGLFTRAVGRAGIPIRYSQGFHPHPKFSFATALSVGVESHAEYMDMEIFPGFGADLVLDALNRSLPEGIRILESSSIPLDSPALSVIMEKVRYRVKLPEFPPDDLPALVSRFLALDSVPIRREKKGKSIDFDLRHELAELRVADNSLEMVIGRGKPVEFARAITGNDSLGPDDIRIEKLEVFFSKN